MERLNETPTIHEPCEKSNTQLGCYTEVAIGNYLENVVLGDYSYTGPHCIIQNARIGKFSNIAAMVRIGPTDHPMDRATQHHFTYRRIMYGLDRVDDDAFFQRRKNRGVAIGHDTWLGHGAIVMSGVNVGIGAVIGAGAVVTKDVPDYGVAVGVPAKTIKHRFPEKIREALKEIAWWNWSHGKLADAMEDFIGPIEAFIEKYKGA